jgi:hypothetical protein
MAKHGTDPVLEQLVHAVGSSPFVWSVPGALASTTQLKLAEEVVPLLK